MRIVGIDPGLTGALALVETIGDAIFLCEVEPMPVIAKRAQGNQIADLLRHWQADMVVVEDLHAMPRGSIASFSLGWSCGAVVAVVQTLQQPLVRMRATEWKKLVGLIGKSKDDSRLLATELFPAYASEFKLKKDDGKAEAALIAYAYHRKERA